MAAPAVCTTHIAWSQCCPVLLFFYMTLSISSLRMWTLGIRGEVLCFFAFWTSTYVSYLAINEELVFGECMYESWLSYLSVINKKEHKLCSFPLPKNWNSDFHSNSSVNHNHITHWGVRNTPLSTIKYVLKKSLKLIKTVNSSMLFKPKIKL